MEKYLITGEVYETKKIYAIFFTGEYFICDLNKTEINKNNSSLDIKIINTLNDIDFKTKLLSNRNNYYISLTVKNDDEVAIVSNIKCFRDPTLISYQYEHYKSMM